MTFQTVIMWVAIGGLCACLLACAYHARHQIGEFLREYVFAGIHPLVAQFRNAPLAFKIGLLLLVGHLYVMGSTKTNAPPAGLPPMMSAPRRMTAEPSTGFTAAQIAAEAVFVRIGTNETWNFSLTRQDAASANVHVIEQWRLRGAANERVEIVEKVEIDTFGRVRTLDRVFSPLGVQVGMVPEANWAMIGRESLAWWMTTPSNTTVVCWQNALLNRDTNTPVSVQAEFFDNGRFEYRYDLSAAGADATNIVARVSTTNGEETVRLDAGVTSVRGWLLGPEDGQTLDKDNDGISTHDEIFIYGTDPELPDTDGDGRSDGEEIRNEEDPLVSDVSDAEILARIAGGATNETFEIVEGVLESTKLWDGFAFHRGAEDVAPYHDGRGGCPQPPGTLTNILYSRTFAIDRKNGWTSYFLSGRGEPWCADGEDAIQDWKLYGAVLEWEDDTGASGTLTASPRNDTLYLPVTSNATSVTISLRSIGGLGNGNSGLGMRHASPGPVFLLEYSPKIRFPGGQEILGDDGNSYSVFTDIEDFALTVDNSNRPCHAATFEGEATEADFPVPTETGVYKLPLGTRAAEDVGPYQMNRPLLMGPRLGAPQNNGNGGDRYLVILYPWVTYGTGHYGCCHDYPYNWGWFGSWCDCTPECGCGVSGYAAVNAYIDWYDSYEAVGVVEVAGQQVWSGTAYHEAWGCTHDPDDEPEEYCPCGCDGHCAYCSCVSPDGPSQGSIRFRVNLGENDDEQMMGFAWFESDGPVTITPDTFTVTTRPDANVWVYDNGSSVRVTTYETGGRDLTISALTNGVIVEVKHHGETDPFETWEITNVENSPSVVRLVKRNADGETREDWTYSCSWQSGEWVWDVADNRTFDPPPRGESVEIINGTNFVFGSDGQLQRLTVGTNGEEVVIRTISYNDNGQVVRVDDGTNGFLTVAYDDAGAVTNVFVSVEDDGGTVPPPLMAPRPRLLGSNGGGMTLLDALLHYRNGNGSPVTLPFSEVNTDGLRPIDFDCVKEFVSSCHEPGSYQIVGTKAVPARGQIRLILGDVTVTLNGTITYTGHCNWTFEGTMSGEDDTYDFNAANRGALGESLTAIGRMLLDGSGTPYTIQFAGSEPLTGSGHCGDR